MLEKKHTKLTFHILEKHKNNSNNKKKTQNALYLLVKE